MYNWKQIEPFLKKVHNEAEEAAQAVFDKYQKELEDRLLSQMGPGHSLHEGHGSIWAKNEDGKTYGLHSDDPAFKFFLELSDLINYNPIRAGFNYVEITKSKK